ncbi:nucleotide sugar dehydrogenase [Telluribacter sp. SYSU D00476]|uniref:nucleotide sugar dehydrogenase n=1 Tax=Telluribacter sp. SYSU D00476 TaxID=2811430 RepID=UPI001FF2F795|nr:nucleotide sugar dehydrogenase [Telluribacter sp. SYSU D00476]
MYDLLLAKEKRIAVIGLGYVGLPIALEFAKKFSVIGFDINADRVEKMRQGVDPSREITPEDFQEKDIFFTSNADDLLQAHFFVVAVPTPVDSYKVPDLKPLQKASELVGRALKEGDYVIFESTVYPGCTEDDCLPLLEEHSGLKVGQHFKIGYSPERINPGDKNRALPDILKIVSGSDAEALEEIAAVYGSIITAGIYKAPTIKVAEAAKVIENTQRDLNISLMNELAIIFDRMGIDTQEVIKAAGTKWNFLKFYPGLVGGHCIGVDPYYLLHKSKQLGYDPQVINSGRRVNDTMPAFVAKKLVQMLIQKNKSPQSVRVLVMGITFKENVADIRNSKVADLVKELMQYSVHVHIVDPHASPNEVAHEYNLTLVDSPSNRYDAVIVAVAHDEYRDLGSEYFKAICQPDAILMDLKGLYPEQNQHLMYWRL